MSSSNPRNGGGPSSRYNEYLDYGKSRRKNFYSSGSNSQSSPSLQGLSRRDFKSNGSGSSSLSHLKDQNPIPPSVSRNGSYSSSSHYNNNYGNYHDYYLGVVVMTHGENPVVGNHDYRHHQIHLQLHHRLLINSTD